MTYTYNDLLVFVPDLKKYVRSKIKTDWWKDVVQETLTYLFIKFKSILITNLKGIVLNTAKMFINKHFDSQKKHLLVSDFTYLDSNIEQKHFFNVEGYNSENISDNLYFNIKNVSKLLFVPFKMQLDDMSIREIAKELNINENTVKTRINRCKVYLKKGL